MSFDEPVSESLPGLSFSIKERSIDDHEHPTPPIFSNISFPKPKNVSKFRRTASNINKTSPSSEETAPSRPSMVKKSLFSSQFSAPSTKIRRQGVEKELYSNTTKDPACYSSVPSIKKEISRSSYNGGIANEEKMLMEIDTENRIKIENMPEQDVLKAQEEIASCIPPHLVEMLRRRAGGYDEFVDDDDDLDEKVSCTSTEQPSLFSSMLYENVTEDTFAPTAEKSSEQVQTNTIYSEEKKREWLQDPPKPHNDTMVNNTLYERITSYRFDFEGRLLSFDVSSTIPVHEGLHHHGKAPAMAGYSLPELLHLLRSRVNPQVILALKTISNIIHTSRSIPNAYHGDASNIVEEIIRQGLVVLLRVHIDSAHQSVICAAIDCLWTLFVDPSDKFVYRLCQDVDDNHDLFGGEMKPPFMEEEDTKANDFIRHDLVMGFLDTGVLGRFRYLLEVEGLSTHTLPVLDLIWRLSIYSPAAAEHVLECPRLLHYLVETYIKSTSHYLDKNKSQSLFQERNYVISILDNVVCAKNEYAEFILKSGICVSLFRHLEISMEYEEKKLINCDIELCCHIMRFMGSLWRYGLGFDIFQKIFPPFSCKLFDSTLYSLKDSQFKKNRPVIDKLKMIKDISSQFWCLGYVISAMDSIFLQSFVKKSEIANGENIGYFEGCSDFLFFFFGKAVELVVVLYDEEIVDLKKNIDGVAENLSKIDGESLALTLRGYILIITRCLLFISHLLPIVEAETLNNTLRSLKDSTTAVSLRRFKEFVSSRLINSALVKSETSIQPMALATYLCRYCIADDSSRKTPMARSSTYVSHISISCYSSLSQQNESEYFGGNSIHVDHCAINDDSYIDSSELYLQLHVFSPFSPIKVTAKEMDTIDTKSNNNVGCVCDVPLLCIGFQYSVLEVLKKINAGDFDPSFLGYSTKLTYNYVNVVKNFLNLVKNSSFRFNRSLGSLYSFRVYYQLILSSLSFIVSTHSSSILMNSEPLSEQECLDCLLLLVPCCLPGSEIILAQIYLDLSALLQSRTSNFPIPYYLSASFSSENLIHSSILLGTTIVAEKDSPDGATNDPKSITLNSLHLFGGNSHLPLPYDWLFLPLHKQKILSLNTSDILGLLKVVYELETSNIYSLYLSGINTQQKILHVIHVFFLGSDIFLDPEVNTLINSLISLYCKESCAIFMKDTKQVHEHRSLIIDFQPILGGLYYEFVQNFLNVFISESYGDATQKKIVQFFLQRDIPHDIKKDAAETLVSVWHIGGNTNGIKMDSKIDDREEEAVNKFMLLPLSVMLLPRESNVEVVSQYVQCLINTRGHIGEIAEKGCLSIENEKEDNGNGLRFNSFLYWFFVHHASLFITNIPIKSTTPCSSDKIASSVPKDYYFERKEMAESISNCSHKAILIDIYYYSEYYISKNEMKWREYYNQISERGWIEGISNIVEEKYHENGPPDIFKYFD